MLGIRQLVDEKESYPDMVRIGLAPIVSCVSLLDPIRSGTIKKCGLAVGSIPLWGRSLRSHMLKLCPVHLIVSFSDGGSTCSTLRSFSSTVSACIL